MENAASAARARGEFVALYALNDVCRFLLTRGTRSTADIGDRVDARPILIEKNAKFDK